MAHAVRSFTSRSAQMDFVAWLRPQVAAAVRAMGSARARRVTLRLATVAIVTIGAALTWNGVLERTWAAPAAKESMIVESAPTVAPVLDKVRQTYTAGSEPQLLTVSGQEFGRGLTAQLIVPLETAILTFPAAALEEVSPTSFRLRTVLDQAGVYTLRVRSADGARSNDVTFTVRPAPRPRARR